MEMKVIETCRLGCFGDVQEYTPQVVLKPVRLSPFMDIG